MLRAILGTVVLLSWLSACTQPLPFKYCETDSDCVDIKTGQTGFCDLTGETPRHACVAPSEVSPQECKPECPSYQACSKSSATSSCVARYTLELTPANGTVVGKDPVMVMARLTVAPGLSATFPDHLNFTAVASDGSTVGSFSATSPTGVDGVYTTQWTPPPQEGTFQVKASYPDVGGPSATTGLTVNLPPSLVLTPKPATLAAAANGFVYADANAPTAWRRDLSVPVRIESDSADLDMSSISVVVHGFNGGADVPGLPVTILTDCPKMHCANVDVPLWMPGLPAFRGTFKIDVTAKDNLGLAGAASAIIPVTRWKWSFDGGAGSLSSPAIGQMGTIYFGTSDSKGKVFALKPEGTKKWENSLGAVKGSPAVGVYSSSLERVYVGVAGPGSSGSYLYALDANGTPLNQCSAGTVLTAVALLNTQEYGELGAFETAVALDDNNSLVALRSGAAGTKGCLPNNASTSAVLAGASVIAKGSDVYFADNDAKIQSLTFNGGSALSNAAWGVKSGYNAPTIGAPVMGMGFSSSGQHVVGAAGVSSPKLGGVFAVAASDGAIVLKSPTSFDDSPIRNMSIGPGNVLFYGRETAGGDLTAIGIPPSTAKSVIPGAGSIVGAPVLGASNLFYTASSVSGPTAGVGEVTAWSTATFNPLWKLSDTVGLVQTSPTIDCARNPDGSVMPATYGVLYVPSRNGSLYAFVVDSPGLDATAPWPKYQHDVRNTGNPDNTIVACPTP